MNMLSQYLLALGAFSIVALGAGCTGTDTDTATDTDTDAELGFSESDLAGTWVGPCYPSPAGDGSFNQLTFVMTDAMWDLDYVAHGTDDCSAPFLTVNIAGGYTLEGASDVEDGARNGTFFFSTKTVTPHAEAAVGVVNYACGGTDAAVDVAFDISGGCPGLGAYPIADCPADYDIVKLSEDGTQLTFGARPADNDMCSEDKRPTTFENGSMVTKQ